MIKTNLLFARMFILLNPFEKLILVCKSYDEDYSNYTELVRRDDLYNVLLKNNYSDYQIWKIN